ncbi:hypothetical protein GCM10025875_21140 [Litorihabitans aurantiacus]|uniref:Uncharacterized protein n=1 Tax=Litorihabitans aurantiacus TaxID=1930061 RepID=A0AA37XFK7_9MICO|nr:hypothetical protein GCM10025875_21140 [Litorihabitans aurantiacus]
MSSSFVFTTALPSQHEGPQPKEVSSPMSNLIMTSAFHASIAAFRVRKTPVLGGSAHTA